MSTIGKHLELVANEIYAAGKKNLPVVVEQPFQLGKHLSEHKGKYALGAGAVAAGLYGANRMLNKQNEVTASAITKTLGKVYRKLAGKPSVGDRLDNIKTVVKKSYKKAKKAAGKALENVKDNKLGYAAATGTGAAGMYGANKLKSHEITAIGMPKAVTDFGKRINTAFKAGKSGAAGVKGEHFDNFVKHVGRNSTAYAAGAAGAAGVGAGLAANKLRSSEMSAMDYFMSITAADYLYAATNGHFTNNVTAAEYNNLFNISAMDYLIMANEESAELAQASDEVVEALADADTEEEVAEILEANDLVKDAHAEKAEELAEYASQDPEDADEAAALAEFHAGKAEEAQEVENDVISALYYN